MHILLLEGDPQTAPMLASVLRAHAYLVDLVGDSWNALWRANQSGYDGIVLDLKSPDGGGLQLCRQLRDVGLATPILVLTARDAVAARIAALDSGADDCVTKPLDFGELLARLRAVIRRGARPLRRDTFSVGSLLVDTRVRHVMTQQGITIRLTNREYALLEYFARHAEEVVSRSAIAEHVWDDTYDPFSNVIDVYVKRLRRKLAAAGCPSVITTRRGAGYMLTAEGSAGGVTADRVQPALPNAFIPIRRGA